ncbi:hypothetical protein F751_2167 [Auxenochlorella protothecoides]|nr:hypothetical protein F751_2167 [Auxenochlorella protothecoides]KFM26580.1 hypothetical protein F751_2167 [Auxenochlorella protothecoides]
MVLRNAEETGSASQALLERIQDSCQAALRMGEQLGNKRQALNEAEARGAQTHAEARRVQADILAAAAAGDAAVHETLTVHKALQAQQDALDMVLTQLHAASQRADREDARTAALRTRLQAQGAWQSQWDAGIRSGAEAAESAEKWLRHLETIVLHDLERQAADLEARLTGAEVAGSRLTARLEDVSAKVKALEAYQGARSGQQVRRQCP